MEKWRDGEIGRQKDRGMGRYGDGEIKKTEKERDRP
jgi:hypothetical protein